MRRLLILLLILPGLLAGAEDPSALPVAWVNEAPIPLRRLEDEMLRKEGAEKLVDMVEEQFRKVPWNSLRDEDALLAIGNWQVPRILLAVRLLDDSGPAVRTELVNQEIVRQAIVRHRVDITREVLLDELQRQEAEFHRRLAEKHQPRIPFAEYLRARQGVEVEEYLREDAVRLAAGLHALVERLAVLAGDPATEQALLHEHYARHRDRFGTPEAWRVSVIHRFAQEKPGIKPEVREDDRELMRQLERDLRARGKLTFELAWRYWGRPADPHADDGGSVGWVGRSGMPSVEGALGWEADLVEALAKAAAGVDLTQGPVLLPLLEYRRGLALVRLHEHRAGVTPAFAEVEAAVRKDLIRSDLERYTAQVRRKLAAEADIRFASWPELLERRKRDARASEQALQAPWGAAAPAPAPASGAP